MADAQVKRWNTANKDDDRKTLNRKSSWSTKKSAPESESSVIGAVITNSFFFSSNTCSRPNESSSSKVVTGVTCIDDIMNILVNIQKEQRSQRKDATTLRTSVDEIYNYTYDNNADYFDLEETRFNESEIDTNNNIRSSD